MLEKNLGNLLKGFQCPDYWKLVLSRHPGLSVNHINFMLSLPQVLSVNLINFSFKSVASSVF